MNDENTTTEVLANLDSDMATCVPEVDSSDVNRSQAPVQALVFEDEVEIDDWEFIEPEPKERWTQQVQLVYRGRQKAPQMIFPDEMAMDCDND